jgi:DNA topoisomerase-1
MENLAEIIEAKKKANMPLGKDPVSGLEVFMLVGRYGPYVKLGTEQKSKMTSIPPTIPLDIMDLKLALKLLELPKTLGVDKMGNEVKVGIGRFGPYILIDSKFRSIPKSYDFLNIELKEALEVFNRPKGIFRGRKRK